MSEQIQASWTIELNCTCPKCNEYVDLLTHVDFWDGRKLDICENMTERSSDIEVVCPECHHNFNVECVY